MGSLANASTRRYQQVTPSHDDQRKWLAQIALVLNGAMQGKLNNTGTVTLTAGVTTTTLSDPRIGPNSYIGLMPKTANAAGAIATTYVSAQTEGSATLTHANAVSVDRTFTYMVVG